MSIFETLQLIDKVTTPAQTMARSVKALDEATRLLQNRLKAMGGIKPLAAIEPPLRSGARSADSFGQSVAKLRAEMLREHKAAARMANNVDDIGDAAKGATGSIKKLDGKDALGALGVGGVIGSGIVTAIAGIAAIGKLTLAAAGAAKDLAVAFGSALIEAYGTRDAAKSLQDTLSGGRGEKVLSALKVQAIATGQSIEDLQKRTVKARDAGASYAEAFKLNLLRADIIASGRSAEEADSAIDGMLSSVKDGSKTAAKGMDELKSKFNVAGNGAKAVEKQASTLSGALTRLKNAPGNIFDEIVKKSSPKLDELGKKISEAFDKFNESGQAAATIDRIVSGITTLIDIAMIAGELFGPLWEGFKQGLAPLQPIIDSVGEALGQAFGEDKSSTMQTLARAAQVLGFALGAAVGFAVLFAGAIITVGGAIAATLTWPALLAAKLTSLGISAVQAGAELINGLVQGIKNGIGKAVKAAEELASAVKAKIKDALKIGSPSKVFAEFGGNVATGFAQGISAGVNEAEKAGGQMAAAPMASAASTVSKGAGPTGGSPFTLTLNVSANPGATAADGEALASGIVPVIRREIASFFEGQALEAGV